MALPPLKSLYYFSVVAEQQSIKAAAEVLFVTQAAVSQQIKTLEAFLGISLFERQHRSLVLTREGKQLLPFLTEAFATINTGVKRLREDTNPNVLTISVLPSFASRWLIPRLQGFYEQYPELTINLSMTEGLEDFKDSNVDLAIRFTKAANGKLHFKPLMKEFVYPVCHPDYLAGKPLDKIRDLLNFKLVDDVDCYGYIDWDSWLTAQGVDKHIYTNRQRYDGSHYVIEAALSQQGIAMVRHSLAAEPVKQGNLVRLFMGMENSAIEVGQAHFICAPEHHFGRKKVQLFSEWLIEQAREFYKEHQIVRYT